MAYKFEPVCGAGRGRRLRSRSAAFAAAISAAVGGAFFLFVTASIWAWVGGFGGRLWVWVPILNNWPFTNLYPSECIQTPSTSDQPSGSGFAGAITASFFAFLLDFFFLGAASTFSARRPVKLNNTSRTIVFLSILKFDFCVFAPGEISNGEQLRRGNW